MLGIVYHDMLLDIPGAGQVNDPAVPDFIDAQLGLRCFGMVCT